MKPPRDTQVLASPIILAQEMGRKEQDLFVQDTTTSVI